MELWMRSQQAWGNAVDRRNKKTLGVGGSDYGHAVWTCVCRNPNRKYKFVSILINKMEWRNH
jgi:hypothetical protein